MQKKNFKMFLILNVMFYQLGKHIPTQNEYAREDIVSVTMTTGGVYVFKNVLLTGNYWIFQLDFFFFKYYS